MNRPVPGIDDEILSIILRVVDAQEAWEDKHGHCSLCGPGDCPGVAALGLHCGECRHIPDAVHVGLDRDGGPFVRVECPTCGTHELPADD